MSIGVWINTRVFDLVPLVLLSIFMQIPGCFQYYSSVVEFDVRDNWTSACKKMKIDPYLSPYTKLRSKWIKDLNIKPVTLNLIEEKMGSTLERIGTGDHFLNITPAAQTLRETINKSFLLKLKSFYKTKDMVNKTKC